VQFFVDELALLFLDLQLDVVEVVLGWAGDFDGKFEG
jgi:hypothetical protein